MKYWYWKKEPGLNKYEKLIYILRNMYSLHYMHYSIHRGEKSWKGM